MSPFKELTRGSFLHEGWRGDLGNGGGDASERGKEAHHEAPDRRREHLLMVQEKSFRRERSGERDLSCYQFGVEALHDTSPDRRREHLLEKGCGVQGFGFQRQAFHHPSRDHRVNTHPEYSP